MASIQKTSWGQVEWLTEGKNTQAMSIGIVSIDPKVRQEPHIHYENEQFIYILQGEGLDIVDGASRLIHPGMFYYLPPNITHETVNSGDTPLRHLMVSVSTVFRGAAVPDNQEIGNFSGSFYGAVEAIRNQVLDNAALPVTIFDDMGNLVLQNRKYPHFCLTRCNPLKGIARCPCFERRTQPGTVGGNVGKVCPHGLTVFCMPIVYQDTFLGSLFSGHILLGSGGQAEETGMYDTPIGSMLAIQQWMHNVVRSIISFCTFNALRRDIAQKDALLAQSQSQQQLLETDLQTMRNIVTNLKINHHFLFNTLNAIAGQALEGDRITTYQTIVDLAKMFRYSTASNLQMVPLRSELEYLQTYLHIQKLRYGEELCMELCCEEEAECCLVPFNFLQPIIENAFTHGFLNYSGEKQLRILINQQEKSLRIVVENNGEAMDKTTLQRVRRGMENSSGHGLSLVYAKLKAAYGDRFAISIASAKASGTRIRLELPR